MTAVVPRAQQSPRGPENELHRAARGGFTERIIALVSRGVLDINQGTPIGLTALMVCAANGSSRSVEILLSHGANLSIASDAGFTALHLSSHAGHLSVTKSLVTAGADLEATLSTEPHRFMVLPAPATLKWSQR